MAKSLKDSLFKIRKEFIFLSVVFVYGLALRFIYLDQYKALQHYFPVLKNSDSYHYLIGQRRSPKETFWWGIRCL